MNYFSLRSFYKYLYHTTYLNRAALCRQYRQPQRCTSKTLDGYNWIYESDFHASFYKSSYSYSLKIRKLVTTRVYIMCLKKGNVNFFKCLNDARVMNHYVIHYSGKCVTKGCKCVMVCFTYCWAYRVYSSGN